MGLDHSKDVPLYYPHAYGLVEPKNLSGMSGMLVVDALLSDRYPEHKPLRERYLLLKDIALPGAADDAPKTETINGTLGDNLRMRPGEMQLCNTAIQVPIRTSNWP